MSLGLLAFWVIAVLLFVVVPTAIVYRRNKGHLSLKASYIRATLHCMRIFSWVFLGMLALIFLPLWLTDVTGLTHWGYPWWTVFVLLGMAAIGYGFQRVARYVLNDEDFKNMVGHPHQ